MIARFRQGSKKLDVAAAPYSVRGLVPPDVVETYNWQTGTSLNRAGGADLAGVTAQNREWSFDILVRGTNALVIEHDARRLASFLAGYGNADAPLYFEYRENDDLPEPLWGQFGAARRYEVVTAILSIGREYEDYPTHAQAIFARVTLVIKPYPLGAEQQICAASGTVAEDTLFTEDSKSKGLRVMAAGDNKSETPVFGASTMTYTGGTVTWTSGWTVAETLDVVACFDPDYIFPGAQYSARITKRAGIVTGLFTETVNVGNTNNHIFWVIAKRHDGAALTSDDLQYHYAGTDRATTFTHLGNGFYACEWSGAGQAADRAAGVVVKMAHTVYICFHMIEEGSLRTYPFHGDQLGCAWAGTAHASAQTRAAGSVCLNLNEAKFNYGHGAISMIWTPDYASTAAGDRYLFSCGSNSFRAYYTASNDTISFTDGTNTATSAALTFAAGDTLRLLFTWGSSGLFVYLNGTQIATNATYYPATYATYPDVYIGSTTAAASHCGGVIKGFTIYADVPTAAERSAIDTAALALITAGERVDYIPWFWSDAGAYTVENADDGTYQNWGVLAGVPGDEPADWSFIAVTSAVSTLDLCLAQMDVAPFDFIRPYLFMSNNTLGTVSIGTEDTALGTISLTSRTFRLLAGRDVSVAVRAIEADDGTLSWRAGASAAGWGVTGGRYYTDYASVTYGTVGVETDFTPFIPMPEYFKTETDWGMRNNVDVALTAKRASGTANFIRTSYQLVPEPMMRMINPAIVPTMLAVSYSNHRANLIDIDASNYPTRSVDMVIAGRRLEPYPERYNILFNFLAGNNAAASITMALRNLKVTPRWSIL